LQNVVERAVILCDGDTLTVDKPWLVHDLDPSESLPIVLLERERKLIEAALEKCRGRVSGPSGAAAKLGIPRQTLESKIKNLRIKKLRYRGGWSP
jgi:formate hydrogenlyase transcriptional activator